MTTRVLESPHCGSAPPRTRYPRLSFCIRSEQTTADAPGATWADHTIDRRCQHDVKTANWCRQRKVFRPRRPQVCRAASSAQSCSARCSTTASPCQLSQRRVTCQYTLRFKGCALPRTLWNSLRRQSVGFMHACHSLALMLWGASAWIRLCHHSLPAGVKVHASKGLSSLQQRRAAVSARPKACAPPGCGCGPWTASTCPWSTRPRGARAASAAGPACPAHRYMQSQVSRASSITLSGCSRLLDTRRVMTVRTMGIKARHPSCQIFSCLSHGCSHGEPRTMAWGRLCMSACAAARSASPSTDRRRGELPVTTSIASSPCPAEPVLTGGDVCSAPGYRQWTDWENSMEIWCGESHPRSEVTGDVWAPRT